MRRVLWRPLAAGLAVLAISLGAACSSSSGSSSTAAAGTTATQDTRPQATTAASTGGMTIPEIVRLADPSIVRIETNGGVGTGFVVGEDGYIVTNNHVVQGLSGRTATTVKVTTSSGADYQAKVIGADARADLALVKVDGQKFPALKFASLAETAVGDDVIAIGFPLDLEGGEGSSFSVTRGIVSAKNRAINEGSGVLGAIQTDAAINHGNSGGPLLNMRGEVVGVNTAVAPDATTGGIAPGIGFAVGADMVKAVYEELKSEGRVNRGLLGIQNFEELRAAKAQALGLPADTRGVVLVETTTARGQTISPVMAGGPAANAGLRTDDVIVKIGEHRVRTQAELAVAMIRHHPGEKVNVEIYRDGKQATVQVTLGTPQSQ